MTSFSLITVDVEKILEKYLKSLINTININKNFEDLNNKELRKLINELCERKDMLLLLKEDILSDYYRNLEEYKNENMPEEILERLNSSPFNLQLGKYTSLFDYQSFRKFRQLVLNNLGNLPITTSNIKKSKSVLKDKFIDISEFDLPEEDTRDILSGIKIGVIIMTYYGKYKNPILTEEEFDDLLNDNMCLTFNFKSIDTRSLTGIMSGILAIEHIFKSQFSKQLADRGIYDFNLNDYNIIIDSYYNETVTSLYTYCKTLLKLKDTDNFNKTIVDTFGFKVGEITMSSMVKVKYLLDYCMSNKDLKYSLAEAVRKGNNYYIGEFCINDSFLTNAEIVDINLDAGFIKVMFLFAYSRGNVSYTSQATLYFEDLFPKYTTSDVRTLALYSTIQKIAYTGTIKPDGSFEYIQVDGVQGKGFLMLPTREELDRMIKISNNAKDLSNAVNYVACELVNQFYSNIFESFLDTTLFVNPSEVFSLKYLLMAIPTDISGVSDKIMFGGMNNVRRI